MKNLQMLIICSYLLFSLSSICHAANKREKANVQMKQYLFAYFTGNKPEQEQIHFALSKDGYNYVPLNNGNPIISSDTISIKKGVT
jgi:hypothetical protein